MSMRRYVQNVGAKRYGECIPRDFAQFLYIGSGVFVHPFCTSLVRELKKSCTKTLSRLAIYNIKRYVGGTGFLHKAARNVPKDIVLGTPVANDAFPKSEELQVPGSGIFKLSCRAHTRHQRAWE